MTEQMDMDVCIVSVFVLPALARYITRWNASTSHLHTVKTFCTSLRVSKKNRRTETEKQNAG